MKKVLRSVGTRRKPVVAEREGDGGDVLAFSVQPLAFSPAAWTETKGKLADKLWRLENIYSIKSADTGKVVRFVPRPEQREIFRALAAGVRKILILKARRLGMSTAIDVYAADEVAFNGGVQVSIVDQNQDDAAKKLNGIVKVALDSLPERVRAVLRTLRSNDSALEICVEGDTPSAIYAGKNARGGTNQILHISEWGVIQADDARRSEEILTGALPSAEHGVTIVETTWKGGRGGHLWNLVREAMELPPSGGRTVHDWHLFFFPWWTDEGYAEAGEVAGIEPGVADYLARKERELGRQFSEGQKCWYARRRRTLGLFIFREFPTTIDECFQSPMEGAIYADLLDGLRARGGMRAAEVDGSALVHTFWDEGSPVNTVTWYVQFVGAEIRVVDCDVDLDLTPVQRVAHLKAKGYLLGNHYLTHASAQTEKSGRTFGGQLREAGLVNVRTVPRTHDIWIGINEVRQLMPRMTFRLPACAAGLEALAHYHTRRETSGGLAVDTPVHDWSSHAADALRTLAEACAAGMVEGGGAARAGRRGRVIGGLRG